MLKVLKSWKWLSKSSSQSFPLAMWMQVNLDSICCRYNMHIRGSIINTPTSTAVVVLCRFSETRQGRRKGLVVLQGPLPRMTTAATTARMSPRTFAKGQAQLACARLHWQRFTGLPVTAAGSSHEPGPHRDGGVYVAKHPPVVRSTTLPNQRLYKRLFE